MRRLGVGGSLDFRWNQWNIEHLAKHSVDPDEAEEVVRTAKRPYPRRIGEEKLLVWGRGRSVGGRDEEREEERGR